MVSLDHNIATLTGHDTFHSTGGIACVTPPGESQQNIIRSYERKQNFAKDQILKSGQSACPVTFDQPLYIKAKSLWSPRIENVSLHQALWISPYKCHMGAIGYIMSGSGLDVLWLTVYADATVHHMLNGHAYARALRAHFLASAALTTLLLTENRLDDVGVDQLRQKLL